MANGFLFWKRKRAEAEPHQDELEQAALAAAAELLGVPAERLRMVRMTELTEERAQELLSAHRWQLQYRNTDGGNRNEKLYNKDKWKAVSM